MINSFRKQCIFDWGRGRSRGSPHSGTFGLAVAGVQGGKEQMCQVFGPVAVVFHSTTTTTTTTTTTY